MFFADMSEARERVNWSAFCQLGFLTMLCLFYLVFVSYTRPHKPLALDTNRVYINKVALPLPFYEAQGNMFQ